MDRRQLLSAAAVALGGALVGLPLEAEAAGKLTKWVILSDPADVNGDTQPDQLCLGGFLFSSAKPKGKVMAGKNKLLGAFGKIRNNQFTGTLLKQVPPLTHEANAIPVILFKSLSAEAKATTTALNESVDVIAALIAPSRDALDQIGIAVRKIDDAFAVVGKTGTLTEGQKASMQDGLLDGRGFLLEADAMIRQLPNQPTPEQLLAVASKVFQAAQAIQEACAVVLPPPPAG